MWSVVPPFAKWFNKSRTIIQLFEILSVRYDDHDTESIEHATKKSVDNKRHLMKRGWIFLILYLMIRDECMIYWSQIMYMVWKIIYQTAKADSTYQNSKKSFSTKAHKPK